MILNQRAVRTRERDLWRALGVEFRRLREDAGRSQAVVAGAAGISQASMSRMEAGLGRPGVDVLLRVAAVLGADLSVRLYPQSGPLIRDRIQVAMSEELLRRLHRRWRPAPETPVYRPVRGVIDVVLEDREGPDTIASELQSQLRRVEQQIRWCTQKTDALAILPEQAGRRTSRLLVLRNTAAMREVVRAATETMRAAYPSRTADAIASLTGAAPWPGPSVVWMTVERGRATLLDGVPRGVAVGR